MLKFLRVYRSHKKVKLQSRVIIIGVSKHNEMHGSKQKRVSSFGLHIKTVPASNTFSLNLWNLACVPGEIV